MSTRAWKDSESLRELFHNLKIGFYVINVQGVFLDASPEFLEIYGLPSSKELGSRTAQELLRLEPFELSLDLLHRDRTVRKFALPVKMPDGRSRIALDVTYKRIVPDLEEVQYHGALIDITEFNPPEFKSAVEELNLRDQLTGAFNRLYLERFEKDAFEEHKSWGCIYIYIDHFRRYCDRYGPDAGKDVLRKMGRFLMRHARAGDAIVRIGEDEFLILLADVLPSTVTKMAKRIRSAALGQAPIPFSLGCAVRKGEESLENTIIVTNRDLSPVQVLQRVPKPQRP